MFFQDPDIDFWEFQKSTTCAKQKVREASFTVENKMQRYRKHIQHARKKLELDTCLGGCPMETAENCKTVYIVAHGAEMKDLLLS